MCEVNRSNFQDLFPKIEASIKESSFIVIDTEFTALNLNANDQSLFDGIKDRYEKQRKMLSQTAICQLGLSAFMWRQDSNKYEVHTYNFYLCPKSFGYIDTRFICQASSLEFLCQHKFDFNKFIYNGIPYLNKEQEKLIKDSLENKVIVCGKERDLDDHVNEHCSKVVMWLLKAKEGDTLLLPISDYGDIEMSQCLIQAEIRQRFYDTWSSVDTNGQIVIQKVSKAERHRLEETSGNLSKKIVELLLGFTRVFRLLVEQKKPLIGHNMWSDLMLMYDKFHRPLPKKYADYKADIVRLFPVIYDTKHISTVARKLFKATQLFDNTNLAALHEAMKSQKGKYFVLYSPIIKHAPDFIKYEDFNGYHEAGYDAFVCGYIFVKMAHICCQGKFLSKDQNCSTIKELLVAMAPYKNNVNIIWCNVTHIYLDGPDPKSNRPKLLHLRSKTNGPLSPNKVAEILSGYGAMDIQLLNSKSALIALPNMFCTKDVLRDFNKHPTIIISHYNVWKHNHYVRFALWGGLILSSGLCIWAIMSGKKQ